MNNTSTPRRRKIRHLQERVKALESQLQEAQATIRALTSPWEHQAPVTGAQKAEHRHLPGPEKPIANEERFRQALQVAPYPLMIWRDDGKVMMVNIAWMEITGYALEDIPTVEDWLQKAYGDRGSQQQQPVMLERTPSPSHVTKWGQFKVTTRSGEKRIWNFSTASLGADEMGRRLVMTMAVDVTYRRQVAKALQASEAKYRSLMEMVFEGLWAVDVSGHTRLVSQRMAEMLGYESPDDLTGRSVFDFVLNEGLAEFKSKFKMRLGENSPEQCEIRLLRRNGSILWASAAVSNLVDEHGNAVGRMAIFMDITERKRAEQALHVSKQRIEALGALADSLPWLVKITWLTSIFFRRYWKRAPFGT
jgi:PAS domain S-box-containing protein